MLYRRDSQTKCNTLDAKRESRDTPMHPISYQRKECTMKEYQQLSREERYTIARGRSDRWSLRRIALFLGRSPSTISREVRRNAHVTDGGYRTDVAQWHTNARRRRSRQGTRVPGRIQHRVRQKLHQQWSPEQIAGHFEVTGLFAISHETIYRMIRLDRKHGGTPYTYTRHMAKARRKGYGNKDYRGRLEGKRHISERPKEVESRLQLGHWEADTVMGRDRHHGVLTLVERATGFGIVKKISCRTAEEVTAVAKRAIRRHRKRFRTITLDNGTEFHNYRELEQATDVICYFATPYHSWERGCNENFNGLLRQYLKKGASMKQLTQEQCDRIADRLNTRPRKRLGWRSPKEVYYEAA